VVPQDTELYGDLRELLIPGFLSTSLEVDNHRIVLRSLSQNDLGFLHKFVRDDSPEWKIHLVAHSIWMVDGVSLLESGSLSHRVAYDRLLKGSRTLLRGMLGTVYGFFARMRECDHYLEAFLYEQESRRLWRGLGNGAYHLWAKSPIPGVEKLGLNPFQSSWVSWNRMEDVQEEEEAVWSNTKVLVSLQSHKGYEQLQGKDKQRHLNEQERRDGVRNQARRRFFYGEEAEKEAEDEQTILKARTVDELEDEMKRWIRGEKDWHDQVVEDYKNRIRQEQEAREAEKSRIMAEVSRQREAREAGLGRPSPKLKPITQEEMDRRRRERPRQGVQTLVEGAPGTHAFNRYLRPQEEPGNLSVDAQGRIVEEPPAVRDPEALNDLIANRRVTLDG
jgi:hypothetical protein